MVLDAIAMLTNKNMFTQEKTHRSEGYRQVAKLAITPKLYAG